MKNLEDARAAVDYVIEKMTIGAANKPGDHFPLPGMPTGCVLAIRYFSSDDTSNYSIDDPLPAWLRSQAVKAEGAGCGNCGEQAALALQYLYDNKQVRTLDYMARTTADHAFVVIGRAANSKVEDPSTWGPTAVVCDPWHEKSYLASEIDDEMYRSVSEKIFGHKDLKPESWFSVP